MEERILYIGNSTRQIKELEKFVQDYLLLFYQSIKSTYCVHASKLERKIIGSNTPEDKNTWNLPVQTFYTGEIIGYEYKNLNIPEAIEETLNKFKIPEIWHIPNP